MQKYRNEAKSNENFEPKIGRKLDSTHIRNSIGTQF